MFTIKIFCIKKITAIHLILSQPCATVNSSLVSLLDFLGTKNIFVDIVASKEIAVQIMVNMVILSYGIKNFRYSLRNKRVWMLLQQHLRFCLKKSSQTLDQFCWECDNLGMIVHNPHFNEAIWVVAQHTVHL